MNGLHKYNQKFEDALKEIDAFLGANDRYYRSLQVRCISIAQDGLWMNVLCFVRVLPTEAPQVRGSRRYPSVHLLEDFRNSPEGVAQLIREIPTGKVLVDSETVLVGDRSEFHEREQLPSRNDYSDSPGYLYNTGFPSSIRIQP